MSLKLDFTLRGHKELMRRLDRFDDKKIRKIIERAARKAVRPVMAAVRAAAPVGPTGNYKKAFTMAEGVVVRRYSGAMVLVFGAGSVAPHAHLVEEGTVERFTTGKKSVPAGISRGVMPKNPIFQQTLNANAGLMEGILVDEISTGIMREA